MLKSYLIQVLKNFNEDKKKKFAGHPLAAFLRNEFPNYLKNITNNPDDYTFSGSAGRGQWTYSPWVAVLNSKITDSVQKGFYVVYLFREDMEGVYLSINQGTIKLLDANKHLKDKEVKTQETLKFRAGEYRKKLNQNLTKDLLKEIDLGVVKSKYGNYYEAGNIFAKYYSLKNMPSEEELESDFKKFMDLYATIIKKTRKIS